MTCSFGLSLQAACLSVKSVTKVLEAGRYRVACEDASSAPRPTAPRITTSGGNVYLNGNVSIYRITIV